MKLSEKKNQIISELNLLYPDPRSELNFNSDYQLVVAVVLSAQCTDKKVNQVTPLLFSEFSNFDNLAQAPLVRVEQIINPINYYKTKARNIIGLAKKVISDFGGVLPIDYQSLISLPGVGNKTASVVLSEKGQAAFPVDTHVFRVSKRLGLAKGANVDQVELELRQGFDPKLWRFLHHWLIFHGRRVCKAQNPLCKQCSLIRHCQYARLDAANISD